MGIEIALDQEYSWENGPVETHIQNGERNSLCIWQSTITPRKDRFIEADWRQWRRFLPVVLQYAKQQNAKLPEITSFAEFVPYSEDAKRYGFEDEYLQSLFTQLPVARQGDTVDAPMIGTPTERMHTVYILGGNLCFGLNSRLRLEHEEFKGGRPQVFQKSRDNPQYTWLKFTREDISHLLRGTYANYCRYRGEITDILLYFLQTIKSGT